MDIAFKLIAIYLILDSRYKVKENIDECYNLLEKGGYFCMCGPVGNLSTLPSTAHTAMQSDV